MVGSSSWNFLKLYVKIRKQYLSFLINILSLGFLFPALSTLERLCDGLRVEFLIAFPFLPKMLSLWFAAEISVTLPCVV